MRQGLTGKLKMKNSLPECYKSKILTGKGEHLTQIICITATYF